MTRTRMLAAIAAAALACGQGTKVATGGAGGSAGHEGGGSGDGGGGGGAKPPADPGGCKGGVTVVLRGVGGAAGSTFDLQLTGIDVSHDGAAHETTWLASGTLSLAAGDARLLSVPMDGCGVLDVTAHVGGARVCEGERCSDAGLCGAPISFRFDPARVDPHSCELVVRLDLGRSVQPLASGTAFLPNLSIRY